MTNSSDEPASFRLELDLDDDPIDVVPMNLAPGERSVHVFEKTSAEGGRLRSPSISRTLCSPTTPPGRSSPTAHDKR